MDLAHVHPIGLLLGAEEDWPHAFEAILRRVGPVVTTDGVTHTFTSERLTIEPFDLTDPVRYELVIDRLAHWYYHPREWLKKAALVNGTYLLNSPFTFQSMEKHSAYCAMLRLGLKVPRTVLVPYKNPVDNDRWAPTSAKYNLPFDLSAIAADLGYPLYMKPFDGGGWRGVSRIENEDELHSAYNESGEMLMHLQATVPHEKFARALSIGPETMVMDFRAEKPMHSRYAVSHDFLSPTAGERAVAISRVVNAFFGWEFNSAEMLVQGDEVYPIDYANACPDVAVTSLHYYFLGDQGAGGVGLLPGHRSPGEGRPADRAVFRDCRRSVAGRRRQARGIPEDRGRALRDRALLGVVRDPSAALGRAGARLGDLDRLRPDAQGHRSGDLSGARGDRVPRSLPWSGRPLGDRRGRSDAGGLAS